MDDWNKGRNHCYTYFVIKGDFSTDAITELIGLEPSDCRHKGDLRADGTPYEVALWEYGRCDAYDVVVANQMMKTIAALIPKADILRGIKARYDVDFTLEIVPSIYAGEVNPCLAPNREVIEFCYNTGTEIDIDLYAFNSTDE